MYHMYVLHVWYVVHVCSTCMYHMYALYVYIICKASWPSRPPGAKVQGLDKRDGQSMETPLNNL